MYERQLVLTSDFQLTLIIISHSFTGDARK